MSEQIKVGDVVMIVRGMPCCGHPTGAEGMIFTVERFDIDTSEWCIFCHTIMLDVMAFGCKGKGGIDLPRLIKINHHAIPETVETDERITA